MSVLRELYALESRYLLGLLGLGLQYYKYENSHNSMNNYPLTTKHMCSPYVHRTQRRRPAGAGDVLKFFIFYFKK